MFFGWTDETAQKHVCWKTSDCHHHCYNFICTYFGCGYRGKYLFDYILFCLKVPTTSLLALKSQKKQKHFYTKHLIHLKADVVKHINCILKSQFEFLKCATWRLNQSLRFLNRNFIRRSVFNFRTTMRRKRVSHILFKPYIILFIISAEKELACFCFHGYSIVSHDLVLVIVHSVRKGCRQKCIKHLYRLI